MFTTLILALSLSLLPALDPSTCVDAEGNPAPTKASTCCDFTDSVICVFVEPAQVWVCSDAGQSCTYAEEPTCRRPQIGLATCC